MEKQWDTIWLNGQLETCEADAELIQHAAIAVKEGKIAWIGSMNDLPGDAAALAEHCYDVSGRYMTPGLIDCHTHLVYAGNRAKEFEQRLNGISYEAIAQAGGGIQSTVTATRQASEEALFAQSLPRAEALMASGVTTIEIKSGYGLDWLTEKKILKVAKRIGETLPLTVYRTFLGAHTTPLEFKNRADDYIDLVCQEMLPLVAKEKLAESVDIFCEKIAFNLDQMNRLFSAAEQFGFAMKCHAEQLSASGAAQLAAKFQALSVDHLEYLNEAGIKALKAAGTIAVLLPGAYYFLRETQLPPIQLLHQYQVPIAIASDLNPGTSPIQSLRIILNMACTLFRMTPKQALEGVTRYAAKALGMQDKIGTLTVGKEADIAIWEVTQPAELVYYMGNNPLWQLIKKGIPVL